MTATGKGTKGSETSPMLEGKQMTAWSETQKQRLMELDAAPELLGQNFPDPITRDRDFQKHVSSLTKDHRQRLTTFRNEHRRPGLCRMESRVSRALIEEGFARVSTPIIMSRGHLSRMGIDAAHPLSEQVFWLGGNKCLRPMLAPHLYYISHDLLRLWDRPVRIFEIGPCFRKETDGAHHSNEFTMLNLVEYGMPEADRLDRLHQLAEIVMTAAGIEGYRVESETSEVYGETLDVVTEKSGLELASGAMGPHPLDDAWKIDATWVGLGFGMERLQMTLEGAQSLKRVGRSLIYLDGIRLNI